jgi:hypothetical protein
MIYFTIPLLTVAINVRKFNIISFILSLVYDYFVAELGNDNSMILKGRF